MAAMEGFCYTELREMPIAELFYVTELVIEVCEARKRATSQPGR